MLQTTNSNKWQVLAILVGLLFSGAYLSSAAPSVSWNSRSDRFTVVSQNETIKSVFDYIESNSDYVFLYDETVNSMLAETVTIRVEGKKIEDILKEVCSQSSLGYSISGRQIAIYPQDQTPAAASNKPVKVTGTVLDETGLPLMGAGVMVKGSTKIGTITDLDGNFSLEVPAGAVLEISFTGYTTVEVAASSQPMKVALDPDKNLLEETVVIGYGTQKKINLTGAVDVVSSEDMQGRSAANTSTLLVGLVPNLNVTVSNGRAGAGAALNIRGVNSISSSTGPLVLVDGIEGAIDDVNPNDIASISVLKDASSAAVYGARAAYGVILITTKNGGDGSAHVTYNGRFTFHSPTTSTDFETRGYYSAAMADLFYHGYQGKNYTNYNDEDYYELWIRRNDKKENPDRPWTMIKDGQYKYYANFDWYNFLFDDTKPTWEHNISVYGGTDKLNYRVSGGYYDQKGVLNLGSGDHYGRWNLRARVNAQVKPWLKISNNTAFTTNSYKFNTSTAVNDVFENAQIHALASFMPYNPDGTYVYKTAANLNGGYAVANGVHATMMDDKNRNKDTNTNFATTFEAVATLYKGLTLTGNYSFSFSHYEAINRRHPWSYSEVPGELKENPSSDLIDKLTEIQRKKQYQAANLFAGYDETFSGHHVAATVGANYETRANKALSMSRTDLLSDDLSDFNLAKGDVMTISGNKDRYALFGVFYRLNYDYKGKYLFEASGRYDGSSRFAKGHRFGFFPSFSAGWRVDQENFFAPAKPYMSALKVRLSWGKLGNQNVGYYDYIQTISSGSSINYAFGENQKAVGASVSAPNASDYTWEVVTNSNIGLDLGFFKDRLTLTGDAYIRDTDGMLMASRSLPSVYGASAPKSNAASLRTKGWEVSINWKDSFRLGNDYFHYSIGGSVSDYISHVRDYYNETYVLTSPYKGQRLGEIWGYVVDGYFKTDEEAASYKVDQSFLNSFLNTVAVDPKPHAGDLKYVDMNGDGKITQTKDARDPQDQIRIGNALPRYSYTIRLGASWKGIEVSALFQGVGHQDWYPGGLTYLFWGPYSRPFQSFVPKGFMSDVWSEENPNAYFPRPRGYVAFPGGNGDPRELTTTNTKYLQNVAYFRMKNLTVGYSLPDKWTKAIHFEKIRVYFSGENLFTLSPLHSKYVDPTVCGSTTSWSTGKTNVNGYPISKVYSFGLDITF